MVPIFSVGKIINSLGGRFLAMGRLNLLGGQMPTQLTCYLPPWFDEGNNRCNVTDACSTGDSLRSRYLSFCEIVVTLQ